MAPPYETRDLATHGSFSRELSLSQSPRNPEVARQIGTSRRQGSALPDDSLVRSFDEDRPLENAYISVLQDQNLASHGRKIQDFDPSFSPKSDSDEEIMPGGKFDTDFSHRRAYLNHQNSQEILYAWYDVVNDFATRKITYHSDKLPAIAGVAKKMSRLTGHRYAYQAGIWVSQETKYKGLLWGVTVPNAIRYPDMIAPSWS